MPDLALGRLVTWYPAGVDPLTPDGSQIILGGDDSSPFLEVVGASNFFLPTRSIREDNTFGGDGSRYRSTKTLARDPQYRFLLRTPDRVQFALWMDNLAVALAADTTEPGTLVIKSQASTSSAAERRLRCIYQGGLEGDPLMSQGKWARFAGFTLSFRAFDPFWYSLEPAVGRWQGKPSTPWLPMTLPFVLDEGGVVEVEPFELDGHVPAFPVWEFQGPFTSVRVSNDATGQTFTINRVTTAEETVRVVTSKTGPSVRVASNLVSAAAGVYQDNAFGSLADGYQLFSIAPRKTVSVRVAGNTAATVVRLSADARWLTEPS